MNNLKYLIPLISSLILVGCGGSSTATPAVTPADKETPVVKPLPLLTLSFTPTKAFHFEWAAVPGATSYYIKEAITVESGFETTPIFETTDATANSFDHIVPLYARVNAKYILYSCFTVNDCTMSAEVHTSTRLTDMINSIGYFKASNTGLGDDFGNSVSLSSDGTTLTVGASGEGSSATVVDGDQEDDTAKDAGAVYVFTRVNKTSAVWVQQAYLKASNASAGDAFGRSMSLSADGSILVVGAPSEDGKETVLSNSGAAYVFTRTDVNSIPMWSQTSHLKASNLGEDDNFGVSISISPDGNTLAVGAIGEDDLASNSGAVYVFTLSNSTWTEQAYLKAGNPGLKDGFGSIVALSADGDTLAVGVEDEDSAAQGVNGDGTDNTSPSSGAVYIFVRTVEASNTTWSEQAYLKASNSYSHINFGISLDISSDGNTLAVGASGEGSNTTGIEVDTNNLLPNSGAVYVFSRSSEVWLEEAFLKVSNPAEGDHFGYSVSLSGAGNTLAVGAYYEDSDAVGISGTQVNGALQSGAVYTFRRPADTTTWSRQAYLKASNTGSGDEFGSSVALSSDGDTLAVGAWKEASSTKGVNADEDNDSTQFSGAVYVY